MLISLTRCNSTGINLYLIIRIFLVKSKELSIEKNLLRKVFKLCCEWNVLRTRS